MPTSIKGLRYILASKNIHLVFSPTFLGYNETKLSMKSQVLCHIEIYNTEKSVHWSNDLKLLHKETVQGFSKKLIPNMAFPSPRTPVQQAYLYSDIPTLPSSLGDLGAHLIFSLNGQRAKLLIFGVL